MTTPSALHAAHPSMATWQEYVSVPTSARDRALTDHLQRCAECADTVRFLSDLEERVTQLPLEPAPNALRTRLLASRAGVDNLRGAHPDVPIWAAAIDAELNDHGYIVPGLGDAGDRLYGTR